jgi:hypothetical protein
VSRALAFGLAALLTLAVAGCGGAATKSEGDVANVPQTGSQTTDGRLKTTPSPLRLADLRSERPGSPQEALLRLFYWAQWGSAPNIASSYDPAIRKRVGVSQIVGAYSQQRASLATSRLRFVESTETSAGRLVSLELLRADGPPARHSFLLRRRDGGWRVVFDTLLEGALVTYVSSIHSRKPADEQPDRRALAQGQAAARVYRDVFASALDR